RRRRRGRETRADRGPISRRGSGRSAGHDAGSAPNTATGGEPTGRPDIISSLRRGLRGPSASRGRLMMTSGVGRLRWILLLTLLCAAPSVPSAQSPESLAMIEKLRTLRLDELGNPQIRSDAIPPV